MNRRKQSQRIKAKIRNKNKSIPLFFLLFFSFISLIADEPHHYHPACGHKGSSHLSPVHALQFFLSRCKFRTLTTRQPMVEFYLLTFPRFLLRKKEHKSYFGKNRTHDFRTSRCAAYLLDHSGDELDTIIKERFWNTWFSLFFDSAIIAL